MAGPVRGLATAAALPLRAGGADRAFWALCLSRLTPLSPRPQFSQALVPSWDQAGLTAALQQMSVQGSSPWVMDTGATTHMHSSEGILLSRTPSLHSSIVVGNGTHIPVISRGQSFLPTTASNFVLNNVLVVPSIVRNLLSVRQFTRDNSCSIEFDAFGFSVKDLKTRRVILQCGYC